MTLAFAPASNPAAVRLADAGRLIGVKLPDVPFAAAVGLDGSATGTRDGRFLAGCSVPRRAAERMIRNETWPGRSLALVTPTHAQQIAAVLDRLGPTAALIVLVARPDDAADLFAVLDFTDALTDGRLHVAWDAASLRAVHTRWSGVAVPQQMARLPDADPDAAAAVIDWAKPALAALAADPAPVPAADPASRRVLARRRFRLWDDAGDTLARTLGEMDADARGDLARVSVLDTDRPAQAAVTLAASFVRGASVVAAADRGRPAWAVDVAAWACWVTTPTVPPCDSRHGRDAVLLADPAWRPLAVAAGWPAERIALAGWPAATIRPTPAAPPAVLLDRPDLSTPADFEDVTARRLVWEAIREELTHDPFAVGVDATAYVRRAPARLGLPADAELPVGRYVHGIVGPAYAEGIVRWLTRQRAAFRLHGRGWDDATFVDGSRSDPVATAEAFRAALAASGGLIDLSLPNALPAAAATGAATVRTFGRTPARVLHDLAALAAGRLSAPAAARPLLSWAVIDAATAA